MKCLLIQIQISTLINTLLLWAHETVYGRNLFVPDVFLWKMPCTKNIFSTDITHSRQHQQKNLISHAHKAAFLSFIITILILRGRRKNVKVFNEARGVMQISFLFLAPLICFYSHFWVCTFISILITAFTLTNHKPKRRKERGQM